MEKIQVIKVSEIFSYMTVCEQPIKIRNYRVLASLKLKPLDILHTCVSFT